MRAGAASKRNCTGSPGGHCHAEPHGPFAVPDAFAHECVTSASSSRSGCVTMPGQDSKRRARCRNDAKRATCACCEVREEPAHSSSAEKVTAPGIFPLRENLSFFLLCARVDCVTIRTEEFDEATVSLGRRSHDRRGSIVGVGTNRGSDCARHEG